LAHYFDSIPAGTTDRRRRLARSIPIILQQIRAYCFSTRSFPKRIRIQQISARAIKEIIGGRGSCANNNKNVFNIVPWVSLSLSLSLVCVHICYNPRGVLIHIYTHTLTLTLSVARGPRNHEFVASSCGKIGNVNLIRVYINYILVYPS